MSTKVEQPSTKISFAVKKGFVIPKNKLSGSLVPTFRGTKKGEKTSNVVDEEINKPVQRKTKWAPDLSQDVAVKKVRALAYQTRVDQITEQLKSGFVDTEDNQESLLSADNSNLELIHQLTNKKSELLELERRETIGEILKLNPSYKPPSDYKPLLKEAKVPVPTSPFRKKREKSPSRKVLLSYFLKMEKIKEHPGYNFIGVIFGSSSDNIKQLEKETGAKVRVYGAKANARDKVEITAADANEGHGAYEELYVHISADTYEKVDAAVALIELLVKPVLVNQASISTPPTPVSGNDAKISDQNQNTLAPNTISPQIPEFPQQIQEFPQKIPEFPQNFPGPPQPLFRPYSFSTVPPQPPTNLPNPPQFFNPMPPPQNQFIPQGHFGNSPRPPVPSMAPRLVPPRGPHSIRPVISGPTTFTNVPPQPMSATSAPPPPPPVQARIPNFTPSQPPNFNTQNLVRPNLDNFTFQPQRPQNLQSQPVQRPIIMQNNMNQNQHFRPVLQNPSPQEILEAILRPLLNQNLGQFPPFSENSNFRPHMGPRNNQFSAPPNSHVPHEGIRNFGNPYPPRPGNSSHQQHNFPPTNRPHNNFLNPNIQIGNNLSVSIRPNPRHSTQQVYDPFSPTAVSNPPTRGGNLGNTRNQEDDPEYENLMNSVGLK